MAKLIISEINTLEGELQSLAVENWPEFIRLIGDEAVTIAKVCTLKKKGKSIGQIANRLNIPKSTAHDKCKRCPS